MITAIEQALQRCNPDKFANLCRLYLAYRFPIINATGLVIGKEKSKKGTPDNFISDGDNYIFNEVTTIEKKQLIEKLKGDIRHCFNQKDISQDKIVRIILICNQEITTKIQEELNLYKNEINRFTKLEVIGLDALATIIFRDFPSLAREIGLTIDTGQILEMSEFITQYEKSKFATPLSNTFYNRTDELTKGEQFLKKSDFLLITGQAGVGKTKFSLELVEKFIQSNSDFIVKYIRNNNQLIWEDLKVQLIKNKKYLIVVDDANKLKSNLSSIITFKNEFKEGNIKIVLTVRNYLKNEVEKELKEYELIELANFDKTELSKILSSPEYNINSYYIDRIYSISKGNPRIALMAAIAGINNDIEKLNKASLILEEYFSSANNTLKNDLTLLKVAGILSLFRTIDISNVELNDEINKYFNIPKNELIEKLSLLVENELADEFKNTYKVADQILGEYIFYLIFIKEKHISFSLLLDLYFDEHKISLMRLLNPIISNYGFEEIKELIIYDLNTKWNNIKSYQDKSIRFLESFWFYLQTETILYANTFITKLERTNTDNLKFELYKDNHIKSYDDKLISLLVNFYHIPEKFEVALELLMKYALSNELVFTKVLKVFKQSFTYERFSFEYSYKTQIQLFDFLYSKIEGNPILYSKIILYISDKYLVDSYQYNEGGNGNKIYFGQMFIVLSEDHKKFREKLLNFIFGCYKNDILKNEVLDFFERHHYSHLNEREKRVVTFDKDLIIPFFLENFKNNSFREASIIKKYTKTLDYSKIKYSKKVKELIRSKEYILWSKLDKKFDRDEEFLEDFSNYSFDDFNEFLKSLQVISENKYNNYSCIESIISPVSDIFQNLASNDFDTFILVLDEIFKYEYSERLYFRKILSSIEYDDRKIQQLKTVFEKSTKTEGLLLELFLRTPPELTSIDDYNCVFSLIEKIDFTNVYFLDDVLDKLEYIDIDTNKEIEKVLNLLIEKTKLHQYLNIDDRFFEIIHDKYQSTFISSLSKIEFLYLYFDNQRRHFDYDLNLLRIILSYNSNFIIDLLKYNFDEKDYLSRRDFDDNNFKKLWELPNYEVIFENMINYFVNFKSYSHRASEFSNVFKGNNQKEIDFLQRKLVSSNDNKMIEFIFNIVTTVYRDKMLDFLKIILDKGCDIELFKRLDFYTSSGVTMGSSLPNMQFELSQYEKVKDFLVNQNNINYYEFIELIERNIMYSKMSIERERKEEFVSEWD